MIIHGQVEPNASFLFVIDPATAEQRVDQFLTSRFPDYSRSYFQQLILTKCVSKNNITVTKPSTAICQDDTILITFPPARVIQPEAIFQETALVTVLHTTEHFMVIYKPPYLLVHPPSTTSAAVTLIDWIKQNHHDIAHVGIVDRPGIVHRLDKDTSGIMIITRTNHAHTVFNNLFKERTIQKTYHALVEGHPEPEGVINLAIGRNPANRTKMAAFAADGDHEALTKKHKIKIRHALTHFKVLQYFQDMSLVEIKPTTGRTHQIRVHMAAVGHPIIGDQTYGKKSPLIDRQALHAHSLQFNFDDTQHFFTNPVPADIQTIIDSLQSAV